MKVAPTRARARAPRVAALIAVSCAGVAHADPTPAPSDPDPAPAAPDKVASRPGHAAPDVDPATLDQAALDAAYARLLERPHPSLRLPAFELFTAVTGGFIWYWADRTRQVADWDFPSIKQRFTFEAWKYDTNPFPINFAWHAYDGAQYHLFARAADLDLLTSMAYGIGTSVAWEFTVEFREQVSINDVLLTSTAGTVIGEFIHSLGRYFESAPEKRWWHPIPGWLLTTSRTANNTIFGYDRLRRGFAPDHLGFSSDIWHRFVLSTGMAYTRIAGDLSPTRTGSRHPALGRVIAEGDMATIPGYLTAPVLVRNFKNANVSSARMRLVGGDDAFVLDFGVDTFMLGHHTQRLPAEGLGTATTVGLDVAYRYRRELIGPYVERLAQTHLPGFALDHHLRLDGGRVWVRARVRANFDFVGVHALAYPTWRAQQPADILETSVVQKHKYDYGWGPSTRLDLMVELPNAAAGGSLGAAAYRAQRGYDRRQDELTDDLHIHDRILDWDGWLRVGSTNLRTFLEARLEQHRRTNTVEDVTQSDRTTTFLLSFGTEQ